MENLSLKFSDESRNQGGRARVLPLSSSRPPRQSRWWQKEVCRICDRLENLFFTFRNEEEMKDVTVSISHHKRTRNRQVRMAVVVVLHINYIYIIYFFCSPATSNLRVNNEIILAAGLHHLKSEGGKGLASEQDEFAEVAESMKMLKIEQNVAVLPSTHVE